MVAIILNYFTKKTSLVNKDVYTVSQKRRHYTIVHIFAQFQLSSLRRRKNCENRSIFSKDMDKSLQCDSKKSPLRLSEFFSFFHKRLRIFNRFFTHPLYVLMYARLQIFMQLSPILTKLCHIKRDNLVHIICTKCPKRAKTRAFRRSRTSFIALLSVVCGKSL